MGLPSVIEAALLPGLIGWGRTREMLLTGALYSAAEALAMGFVQKVGAGRPSSMPRSSPGSPPSAAPRPRPCARRRR